MSGSLNAVASSSRSDKKHKSKSKDKERKDKGKSKDKSEKTGPFEHRTSRLRLSIPPRYGADYMAGVKDILNGMLMRYVPQMNGVLLAHWEHELLDDTVNIINECPFGVCEVQFYSILWAPKIGQKLYGTHSLSSPSHISLLFSKTFNISIPLQHIPTDTLEFEHTAPEDDADLDSDDGLYLNDSGVEEVGRWKRKSDGKLLGEGGKAVKFTVIGMQVTNQMLSLTGSLLDDPSNPPPPPEIQSIRAPSPSPTPSIPDMQVDEPLRPAKKSKVKPSAPTQAPYTQQMNGSSQAPVVASSEPQIDERFLSARELKAKHKADQKKKRDERKSRKEEKQIDVLEEAGAEMMVGVNGDHEEVGLKRKAGAVDGEVKKRKKARD